MLDLKPTNITIILAYHSVQHPTDILEDIQVQIDKFVVPCDFIVLDMDDSLQASIILGRPFLSTTGAIIDVAIGKISFHLYREKIDFCFPSPMVSPMLTVPPIRSVHRDSVASIVATRIEEIGGDPMPQGRLFTIFESPLLISYSFGGTFTHPEEGMKPFSPSLSSSTTA